MLITVETTLPLDDAQVDDLLDRLNVSDAFADTERLLHFDDILMLQATDRLAERAAALDDDDDDDASQAPLRSQLAVVRSQAFYAAAACALAAPTTARLRSVHIESATEHIVLADVSD